ncbi:MAG: alkaline phosphatase [Eubacteriales bacterium]|nr:alkaline phosphatase [Eubacteriales bacterium]
MNKKRMAWAAAVCVLAAGTGLLAAHVLSVQPETKYVFLFIGDGMGNGVTKAAEELLDHSLAFQKFPVTGFMNTDNVYGEVTDSAAAITAMICGHKTKNGRIGMDREGTTSWESAAVLLEEAGWAVGVLSTAPLNHATPAGFYAAAADRTEYDSLAGQAIRSDFLDILGGGGFLLEDMESAVLLEEAEELGWNIVDAAEIPDEGEESDAGETQAEADVADGSLLLTSEGVYSSPFMEYEIDRLRMEEYGNETVSLADITREAIELLEERDRFFLAAESAMIDSALHQGDLASAVYEVAALDDAVGEAVEFYRRHPEETLIVVLADHETGGVTLPVGYDLEPLETQRASWSRVDGYIRELLDRNANEQEFLDMIDHYLGLGSSGTALLEEEEKELLKIYRTGEKSEIRDALFAILQKKADISFSTDGHTAAPVTVYAMGNGQQKFSGCLDNTEIFYILSEL